MEDLEVTLQFEAWKALLKQQKHTKLLEAFVDAPTVEVAEFLSQVDPAKLVSLLILSPKDNQGAIFADFNEGLQMALYHLMDKKKFSSLFSHIPSNQRADFYQKLSDKEQARLLPYLTKKIKEDVIKLSAYPPEAAGGIMNTDFSTVISNMTIAQAIVKLREDAPSKKRIYYIYVVNEHMEMIGFVTLRDLIMAKGNDKVDHVLHDHFIYADVYEDREAVAQKIGKYDLVAIPVLNEERQLVGIVSHDDAIDVIKAEQTEDMEKFMGIVHHEEESDYLKTSSLQHFKKRVLWLVGLFVTSFISGIILHKYEPILAQLTMLALYIPMIADTGGNAGSQAAAVVIRALSLGQVSVRHWLRIIFKETKVGFLLGGCLFFLAFLKVILLSSHANIGGHSLSTLAFAIALALSLQVLTSIVIGTALPLVVKCFQGDPSVAASPAITTLVDITGMLLYFSIIVASLA